MTANAGGQPRSEPEHSAAENIRRAFAALPLDQRISTLIRIELDLVGDVADAIISAVSKAADEAVRPFCKPSGRADQQKVS
jgi:transcriptional regulator